jgi:hypothetical protein
VLHRNSAYCKRRAALASSHNTSRESEDSTGPSDKRPVLVQRGLPTSKQGALLSTENVLPHRGFSMGTRPFSWKGTCRRTVSLFRRRVPQPTCTYSSRGAKKWQWVRTHMAFPPRACIQGTPRRNMLSAILPFSAFPCDIMEGVAFDM